MESLYNRGFVSYPRTETNIFNPTIKLKEIAKQFTFSEVYGEFTEKLLKFENKLFGGPRKGNKDDKSHPPIHPVKLARNEDFQTPTE